MEGWLTAAPRVAAGPARATNIAGAADRLAADALRIGGELAVDDIEVAAGAVDGAARGAAAAAARTSGTARATRRVGAARTRFAAEGGQPAVSAQRLVARELSELQAEDRSGAVQSAAERRSAVAAAAAGAAEGAG